MRMIRRLTVLALPLLEAQSSPMPLPNVVEAGRVAANLSDMQTTLYFLMVLIVCLLVERWAAGFQARRTANQFASAADTLSKAMMADGQQTTVQLALIQRELSDIRARLPTNE